MALSRGAAIRTSSVILFGATGALPGIVVLLGLGTWDQAADKGPFIVVVPSLMSALSGAAWSAHIVAARSRWGAAIVGGLAGIAAVVGWVVATAMYFGIVETTRSRACESLWSCGAIGLLVATLGGGWAIPPLAALAGLAVREVGRP